jgi:hypothetical protein
MKIMETKRLNKHQVFLTSRSNYFLIMKPMARVNFTSINMKKYE